MTMPEGRALDAWLHEALGNCAHVWEWVENSAYLWREPDDDRLCTKCGIVAGGREHVISGSPECPAYTTDPSAALALAEAMRAKGYSVYSCLIADWEPVEQRYSVQIVDCVYTTWPADADTLPGAISLAAFRALGGEK